MCPPVCIGLYQAWILAGPLWCYVTGYRFDVTSMTRFHVFKAILSSRCSHVSWWQVLHARQRCELIYHAFIENKKEAEVTRSYRRKSFVEKSSFT